MLWVSGSDYPTVQSTIKEIFDGIKEKTSGEYSDIKLIILGPCAASVPRVNGKYRHRMIIKCKNTPRFREMLKSVCDIKLKRDTTVGIDINPETII